MHRSPREAPGGRSCGLRGSSHMLSGTGLSGAPGRHLDAAAPSVPRPRAASGVLGASSPEHSPRAAGPAPAAPGHVRPAGAQHFPADADKLRGIRGPGKAGGGGGRAVSSALQHGVGVGWGHTRKCPHPAPRARGARGRRGEKLVHACDCRRGVCGDVQETPGPPSGRASWKDSVGPKGRSGPQQEEGPSRGGGPGRPGKARTPVSGGRAL